MTLNILTPQWSRTLDVDAVFFPGSMCPFEVLTHHAPLVSTLESGSIRWRTGGKEDGMQIRGGVVRVLNDVMTACVEEI